MSLHTNTDFNATTKASVAKATDNELVDLVRKGNLDAFEVIMRRHNQRLYRIARSVLRDEHEAMDVVQESYVKAYYQLHQFKGPDGFVSWLSRIASNEAIMRIRKSKFVEYTYDDPSYGGRDDESLESKPLDNLANEQLRELLEKAIDQLSVGYRSVYVMRAVQQLSTRETADLLNITEDLVKTRYLRAKKALKKTFEAHLSKADLSVFEFAGYRCDALVQEVMVTLNKRLDQPKAE